MLLPITAVYGCALFSNLVTGSARIGHEHQALHQHKHRADIVAERQLNEANVKRSRPVFQHATKTIVLTYITPSPGASPVAVTKESQIVTSYSPQFTICELPPIAEYPISPPLSAPFRNYSVSIPTGTGTCSTIFTPTITMVCAATLTALDKLITVTNCDEITFSTQYGYSLITPTPTPSISGSVSASQAATITAAPSIATLTTYYLAPWQQLTAGTAPSEVDLKVYQTFGNDTTECVLQYQVWETSLLTRTATTTTSVNISTTIHGPSQIIVETFVANVTETLTTFTMSTTMALEYQTEYTTTNSRNRTSMFTAVPISTGPTVYETLTVEEASKTGSGVLPTGSGVVPSTGQILSAGVSGGVSAGDLGGISTTHVRVTSTIYVGTKTVTILDASAGVGVGASILAEATVSASL